MGGGSVASRPASSSSPFSVVVAIVEQTDDVDIEAGRGLEHLNGFLSRRTATDNGDAFAEAAGAIERNCP